MTSNRWPWAAVQCRSLETAFKPLVLYWPELDEVSVVLRFRHLQHRCLSTGRKHLGWYSLPDWGLWLDDPWLCDIVEVWFDMFDMYPLRMQMTLAGR